MTDPRLFNLLCAFGAALVLAGCAGTQDAIMADARMVDHDRRHPIQLRQDAYVLDLYEVRLDSRATAKIAEFVDRHRRLGAGPVLVSIPGADARDRNVQARYRQIRAALSSSGLAAPVRLAVNPAAALEGDSTVRLTFSGLKAVVPTRCGEWREDLGSGSSLNGWDNRPYWNNGCAVQSMIAAQTADPRDLVNARAETPKDTEMRLRAITNIRRGADPATNWNVQNSAIGSVGSK